MNLPSRSVLDRELNDLENQLAALGSLVEAAIEEAMAALAERNVSRAQQVIRNDEQINVQRYKLEEDCLRILATQQPKATDLRTVLATLHIAIELERMGDHAAGIAALRQPGHAGGKRSAGATGRAGHGTRAIPRVQGGAEDLVEGVGAGAEFRRGALGEDDGALGLEIAHLIGAAGRDVVGIDRRAEGGAHAFDLTQGVVGFFDQLARGANPDAALFAQRIAERERAAVRGRGVDATVGGDARGAAIGAAGRDAEREERHEGDGEAAATRHRVVVPNAGPLHQPRQRGRWTAVGRGEPR